jgi:hypothetical protein
VAAINVSYIQLREHSSMGRAVHFTLVVAGAATTLANFESSDVTMTQLINVEKEFSAAPYSSVTNRGSFSSGPTAHRSNQ